MYAEIMMYSEFIFVRALRRKGQTLLPSSRTSSLHGWAVLKTHSVINHRNPKPAISSFFFLSFFFTGSTAPLGPGLCFSVS
jgi:hypothetical protein